MKPISFTSISKLLNQALSSKIIIIGAAIDSRQVNPGDLFFALPGEQVDGHDFLQQAAANGAVAAVVKADYQGETFGLELLRVVDVRGALQQLARLMLEQRSSKVVAITGSIGKTTTKEFLATLLGGSFRVFASPRSYNTQLTVPLSILMADGDEDILILEMGMTHVGQIEKLVSIAPPDIALLTKVAIQHTCNFLDGISGIAREKGMIFSNPKTFLGIVDHEVHHLDEIVKVGNCSKRSFSMVSKEADDYLELIPGGVRVFVKGEDPMDILLNLPMKELYHNFLAAVVVARSLELPWSVIQERAKLLKLPPMRFEQIEKQGILFINDAYNANPDAMKAAIENLPKPQSGKKRIGVLGEMDALGMYSEGGHTLVAEVALEYLDQLICLGSRCEVMQRIWHREKKPVVLCQSREEVEEQLQKCVEPGDVVLLKGCRACGLDRVIDKF
ncbi:MAG: UDP-N-acetylmuramoyl-tripeptide--D-alanyl-D-alanine ligase [Chlamydiae bacterium]|nr:UDP-N-acetylmuramoyl-tripeptide--D-alanyl-D-alanine ligase [Chlamydiota bacterium]